MSDEIISKDQDSFASSMYGLPCGLYFYMMSEALSNWDLENDPQVLGHSQAIQSVQYVPFLEPWDCVLERIDYDNSRFSQVSDQGQLVNTPSVYRIKEVDNPVKELGKFTVYDLSDRDIGGVAKWQNESRLYNYPYSFAMLTDNLNPPIEIKYHLCKYTEATVKVINTISDRCSYGLYVEGYKGDTDGKTEAMVSGDAHELPCSSNAYSNWVATNKNQITQNIKNQQATTLLQNQGLKQQLGVNNAQSAVAGLGALGGALGGILSLDFDGASNSVMYGMNTALSAYGNNLSSQNQIAINNQQVQNSIQMAMAQANDMKSIPNTMISMGSDIYYGYVKGQGKVSLFRYSLADTELQRLGIYFIRYGYKLNRFDRVWHRNRYYFNYIKTVGACITGDVPRDILESLIKIFDNGVTMWHMDRKGVECLDYTKDNYECDDDYDYSSTTYKNWLSTDGGVELV